MNHHLAHELLEALKPECKEFGLVLRSVKFDLGDYDGLEGMSDLSTKKFWNPPFPVCLFQATLDLCCHMFLTTVEEGERLHVTCFYKNEATGYRWEHASINLRVWFDGSAIGFFNGNDKDITNEVMASEESMNFARHLTVMARCMEVFSCSNVASVEHQGPTFINKKRALKNRPPIFSFRTVHITGDDDIHRKQTPNEIRTAPRLHLRRGHIRRISDDRRIWVRSTVVGDKSSGFVAKDYRVHQDKFVGA